MSRTPETLLDDIASLIERARTLLSKGELLDLAGMDGRMRELCDEVLALPAAAQAAHRVRMQALFLDLSALERAMEAEKTKLAEQICGLSGHHKANVAYRTATHLAPPQKKDHNA